MISIPKTAGRLIALAAAMTLVGCTSSTNDDLAQWMAGQRNTLKPRIEPVQEPVPFEPQAYTTAGAVEPFSTDKFTVALGVQATSTRNAALVAAELNRRKEPLELVPLDTMSMVGLLDQAGRKVALVRAGGLLYQVTVGNYMGQNYGRVTSITETEITLREIAQDGVGEWIERPAALQLQEGTTK
ncbi:MAG: pilus assembly protein PilP [Serpentinimonas sp.]|jgi:type IV pilus assembly protein PilP|nr:pilus assembly protein PilP [Serpentinimonas sp.]